jgi:hypothetical protein
LKTLDRRQNRQQPPTRERRNRLEGAATRKSRRKPQESFETDSQIACAERDAGFDAYSCGNAIGSTGTADATGPGPAPSR